MKKALSLLILSAAVLFAGTTPTNAATYNNCDCDPLAGGATGIVEALQCSCSSDHTLGKLGTTEFRASCTNANALAVRTELCVTGRDKNTTCTIQMDGTAYDVTRSCTNWSLTRTDTVTVTTYCNADHWKVIWHCD